MVASAGIFGTVLAIGGLVVGLVKAIRQSGIRNGASSFVSDHRTHEHAATIASAAEPMLRRLADRVRYDARADAVRLDMARRHAFSADERLRREPAGLDPAPGRRVDRARDDDSFFE